MRNIVQAMMAFFVKAYHAKDRYRLEAKREQATESTEHTENKNTL